jgi:hypothetical protein
MMPRMIAATLCAAASLLPLMPAVLAQTPTHPPRLGGPLVDGSVVRTRGCGSHFFIAYRDEFALASWLGGEPVREGDVLQGADDLTSFEREGRMTFTNLATGRTVDVVIEKALLNRTDYSRTIGQVCR